MSHSLRYEVNCSIIFTELPLLERPAAAKAAGFDAVEYWWPFAEAVPADKDADAFVRAIRDAGVSLVGLNFFAGDMPGGDRGLVSWTGRESEFRDNIDATVGIADQLGCKAFNALYGNRIQGQDPKAQDELGAENLARAAVGVAGIGGTVLVEPVSGSPDYPLLTAGDALAVIDRVQEASGADNIGLLADLYHLTVNGDDVDKVIADQVSRIAHVQIADSPGRGEPGSGDLPIDDQLTALERGGYNGWVGLEYKPTTASADSFEWVARDRRGSAA